MVVSNLNKELYAQYNNSGVFPSCLINSQETGFIYNKVMVVVARPITF